MVLFWFLFFASLTIVLSRSHYKEKHHHHGLHFSLQGHEETKEKPVLYFDKPQDSVSKNLGDFFGKYISLTTQPACSKHELCYGPSKSNVLFAVCYDGATKIPVFSAEFMPGTYGGSRPSTDFKKDANGPAQADSDDYSQTVQLLAHNTWTRGRYYLARGHLTASADLGNNQEYTFVMTNIAPQWQAFNNGNWKALETALRTDGGKYLVVTGTANPIPGMALGLKTPVVAVPKYFWKAVCDTVSKQSLFFVAENPVDNTDATKKANGCGVSQTETRGVIQCGSVQDAIKQFNFAGIPDFKGCDPSKEGLASLKTELQQKLK